MRITKWLYYRPTYRKEVTVGEFTGQRWGLHDLTGSIGKSRSKGGKLLKGKITFMAKMRCAFKMESALRKLIAKIKVKTMLFGE